MRCLVRIWAVQPTARLHWSGQHLDLGNFSERPGLRDPARFTKAITSLTSQSLIREESAVLRECPPHRALTTPGVGPENRSQA